MTSQDPRAIRRRILLFLYDRYHEDPLQMLSPEDFFQGKQFTREELPANVHYLYERGLIELLVGYNPPLFAAARISPAGIDLVEDLEEFDRRFPANPGAGFSDRAELLELILLVAEEAERASLSSTRRQWLLGELNDLRALIRRPNGFNVHPQIRDTLDAIEHLAQPFHDQLKKWPALRQHISAQLTSSGE